MKEIQFAICATNIDHESDNKIHDDAVASRFGFAGGLVPGAEVYGYMSRAPVGHWGLAWFRAGDMTARFIRPVYDGQTAVVTAMVGADAIDMKMECDGILRAVGRATLGVARGRNAELSAAPRPDILPEANEATLAPGTRLSSIPLIMSPAYLAEYRDNIGEMLPFYTAAAIGHPGLIPRICNMVVYHNVQLGPWIHVASAVTNLDAIRGGDTVTAHSCVTANYEKKGHRFIELDISVVAEDRSIARVFHTAIYRPRQIQNEPVQC